MFKEGFEPNEAGGVYDTAYDNMPSAHPLARSFQTNPETPMDDIVIMIPM